MSNIGIQQAAREQRTHIPTQWQIEFNDWSSLALASFANDASVNNPEVKAFAQWELNFRNAFGIEVDFGPDGYIRRLETDADFEKALAAQAPTIIDRAAFWNDAVAKQLAGMPVEEAKDVSGEVSRNGPGGEDPDFSF